MIIDIQDIEKYMKMKYLVDMDGLPLELHE